MRMTTDRHLQRQRLTAITPQVAGELAAVMTSIQLSGLSRHEAEALHEIARTIDEALDAVAAAEQDL